MFCLINIFLFFFCVIIFSVFKFKWKQRWHGNQKTVNLLPALFIEGFTLKISVLVLKRNQKVIFDKTTKISTPFLEEPDTLHNLIKYSLP